jgi:hypothetical protein
MAQRCPSNREPASPTRQPLHRSGHQPIRPWPSLPTDTQTQMAQLLAELVRRMHAVQLNGENADAERHHPF